MFLFCRNLRYWMRPLPHPMAMDSPKIASSHNRPDEVFGSSEFCRYLTTCSPGIHKIVVHPGYIVACLDLIESGRKPHGYMTARTGCPTPANCNRLRSRSHSPRGLHVVNILRRQSTFSTSWSCELLGREPQAQDGVSLQSIVR